LLVLGLQFDDASLQDGNPLKQLPHQCKQFLSTSSLQFHIHVITISSPFMPKLLASLRHHTEPILVAAGEAKFCMMSRATMDRLMKPFRHH
jgi:hypothetical protein